MSNKPQHILFVCTGNTCRSPMAEGIFQERFQKFSKYKVSSAGLHANPKSPASQQTLQILDKRGVDFSDFRSQQLDVELVNEADYIFCMAQHHKDSILLSVPDSKIKVYLLSELIDKSLSRDIFDPYGMDMKAYEEVETQLDEAISNILDFISSDK